MSTRRHFIAATLAALAVLAVDGPAAFAASARSGVADAASRKVQSSGTGGKRADRKKNGSPARKASARKTQAAQSKKNKRESKSGQGTNPRDSEKLKERPRRSRSDSKPSTDKQQTTHIEKSRRMIENEPDLVPQRASRFGARRNEAPLQGDLPEAVRDYMIKMRNFDSPAAGDLVLSPQKQVLLTSVMDRLDRLQKTIGHGWFYLLGLDEAVKHARRPAVGAFTGAELSFLEELFNADASGYGFLDSKPISAFTAAIAQNKVVKVSGMGNFIYRGQAEKVWRDIQAIMGNEVVLTSGVRGVIKQFHLFLAKAQRNGGNLSLASRSLAPPGYSFHGVGDFDVGQRGFGVRNFMTDFTTTPVFQTLSERGFISLRYPRDNFLGVRFEPWHVKVNV